VGNVLSACAAHSLSELHDDEIRSVEGARCVEGRPADMAGKGV
jgi:hypothetical protein